MHVHHNVNLLIIINWGAIIQTWPMVYNMAILCTNVFISYQMDQQFIIS